MKNIKHWRVNSIVIFYVQKYPHKLFEFLYLRDEHNQLRYRVGSFNRNPNGKWIRERYMICQSTQEVQVLCKDIIHEHCFWKREEL